MIFNTIVGFYGQPSGVGLVTILLASYAVTELIDRDFTGPFNILAIVRNMLTDDYCSICATFWVAVLMMAMPTCITVPFAAIGVRFMVDYILSALEGK